MRYATADAVKQASSISHGSWLPKERRKTIKIETVLSFSAYLEELCKIGSEVYLLPVIRINYTL